MVRRGCGEHLALFLLRIGQAVIDTGTPRPLKFLHLNTLFSVTEFERGFLILK